MAILIFLNSKPLLLLLNLTKELKLTFHHIKIMMFETAWSKKLLSHSAISFSFTNIYRKGNFDRFSYGLKPVDFRAISISLLNFLSQKTYLGKFQNKRLSETEVMKERVIFKMSVEAHQFAIF